MLQWKALGCRYTGSELAPVARSVISASGQKFNDPAADHALFEAIRSHLREDIELRELDAAINDAAFAEACAITLLKLIKAAPARARAES